MLRRVGCRLRAAVPAYNVCHSRDECLAILAATQRARPAWWNDTCDRLVERTRRHRPDPRAFASAAHPVVVLEGIDGVGKSVTARALAERLGAVAIATPPAEWASVRSLFRTVEEPVARAFYCAANYLAAEDMAAAAQRAPVVVDRWWLSTCVMAIVNSCPLAELPPAGAPVYAWPPDLPLPTAQYLLYVDEATRAARMHGRGGPQDAEERRLAAQAELRAAASEAYTRSGLLHPVEVRTYRHAVNNILEHLKDVKGVSHGARLFSAQELTEVKPF